MADQPAGAPGRAESAPWDRTLESWNPILTLLLAVVGAVGAVLLLLVGASWTADSRAFVSSQGFAPWAAVIAVQGAFWVVVTVPLWREVAATYTAAKPARTILVIPAAVIVLLALLAVGSPARGIPWPLVGHHAKVWVLTAAAAVGVGLPAIFGICIVQDRVRRHTPTALGASDIHMAVEARAQIKRFLGLAGTAIGLAVLAAGALQKAVVPQFVPATKYPASSVLLYGAFFTAILLVVYLPAHLSLRRFCADLRETWYPSAKMPDPTSDEIAHWLEGRKRLDTLTQAEMTVTQQLQATVFVLTPLLSAILGSFIPKAG